MTFSKQLIIFLLFASAFLESSWAKDTHSREIPSKEDKTELNFPNISYNECIPTKAPIVNFLKNTGEWISFEKLQKEDETNTDRESCCLWNCMQPPN